MSQLGTGTGISIGGAAMVEIIDVRPPGMSRAAIDVTHMKSEYTREKMPAKLIEWGDCEVDIMFDPGWTPPFGTKDTSKKWYGSGNSGATDAIKSCVITFPEGDTWTFDAFISKYDPKDPVEDKMTATVSLTVCGDVARA